MGGADFRDDYFLSLCSGFSSGGYVSHNAASIPLDGASSSEHATPSLQDAEALLRTHKRSRLADGSARVRNWEPWTAVGTTLDWDSLEIRCRPERAAPTAALADTIQKWREWAASAPTAFEIEAEETDPAIATISVKAAADDD